MYYIIQENLFQESHYEILLQTMGRFKFEYEIVKFRPFIHEVEFTTDRKDVFCFGAVAMAHSAKKYGWTPGSMMNENHDFEVYGKHYGTEMLNHGGKIIEFGDDIPFDDFLFFARPTLDTKIFSGQVFTKHSWKEYVIECTANDAVRLIKSETKVLVAPLKEIQQEIRCWMVGGKAITISRYKLGNFVRYENYDHEEYIKEYAEKMAKIFSPAEAFVLDVAITEEGLKVVEINCINCAGFYHANIQNLIAALEEHFV